jgi:hypothetical protein
MAFPSITPFAIGLGFSFSSPQNLVKAAPWAGRSRKNKAVEKDEESGEELRDMTPPASPRMAER